jgi:hypothetical protein
MVVVASRFPEAGLILFHETQAAYPLGALPEVQMWHNHTGRATVLGRKRFVVVFKGNERLTVDDICKGHIRGVAAVTKSSDEHGFAVQLHMLEQGVQAYTPTSYRDVSTW